MKATKVFKKNLQAFKKQMIYADLVQETEFAFVVMLKSDLGNNKIIEHGEYTLSKDKVQFEKFLFPSNSQLTGCISFYENPTDIKSIRRYRYIINEGSSRSSKTYSILQLFIYILGNFQYRCTVWRNEKTTCRATLLKDFNTILYKDGQFNLFRENKTEGIFYNDEIRSSLEFNGTDDKQKVHGLTQDIAYFNEINEVGLEVFNQIDQRTNEIIFVDWNPSEDHFIDNIKNNPRAIVIHSTYRDNPFCPEESRIKLDSYEPTPENIAAGTADEYMWQVYGLGLKAEKPHQIYSKKWKIISKEHYNALPADEYYGLDFGSNNPTALVGIKIYEKTLYIDEKLYKPGKEIHNLNTTLDGLIYPKRATLVADSADPISIIAISDGGFNIFPALKGSGSVVAGIKIINEITNIYITNTSENLAKEKHSYSWHIDRYGLPTDEPIKKDDHLLDALRYIVTFVKNTMRWDF
jgi:phage terminase large subunit